MTMPLALIIEDDYRQADIYARALQAAGFITDTVGDGQVAMARLASVKPRLILLDLHLPNVSGDQILQHIRADERLARVFVIVVTADMILGGHIGHQADMVLVKPISPTHLRDLARGLSQT